MLVVKIVRSTRHAVHSTWVEMRTLGSLRKSWIIQRWRNILNRAWFVNVKPNPQEPLPCCKHNWVVTFHDGTRKWPYLEVIGVRVISAAYTKAKGLANQRRAAFQAQSRWLLCTTNEWSVGRSMLPFEPSTLCCELKTKHILKMPRVVSNQRAKFENDEIFRKLSRECEVSSTATSTWKAEPFDVCVRVPVCTFGLDPVLGSVTDWGIPVLAIWRQLWPAV